MIFVTVGTHEQQFNRLIEQIDLLKKEGIIKDEVFIQIGFSDYIPEYCQYSRFLEYDQMTFYINKSDIVITHGGPATFMDVLSKGKTPIVVPRLLEYAEHVNNHQLLFSKKIFEKYHNIIVVSDIQNLSSAIINFDDIVSSLNIDKHGSNNSFFCEKFEKEVERLIQ